MYCFKLIEVSSVVFFLCVKWNLHKCGYVHELANDLACDLLTLLLCDSFYLHLIQLFSCWFSFCKMKGDEAPKQPAASMIVRLSGFAFHFCFIQFRWEFIGFHFRFPLFFCVSEPRCVTLVPPLFNEYEIEWNQIYSMWQFNWNESLMQCWRRNGAIHSMKVCIKFYLNEQHISEYLSIMHYSHALQ